jgi:hypothetical protein
MQQALSQLSFNVGITPHSLPPQSYSPQSHSHRSHLPHSHLPRIRSPQSTRLRRCAWCDSQEHIKSNCFKLELAKTFSKVHINDANRVVYSATGTELPVMVGKGGMKVVYNRLLESDERLSWLRSQE